MDAGISFKELFIATVNMINVSPTQLQDLNPKYIRDAFRVVLEARKLCEKDFTEITGKK
jgi:hypothetical protein